MKTFNILGKSNSTIACILENLYSIYEEDFQVKIIKNIDSDSDLPFAINNITIREVFHTEPIIVSNCIMGATRVLAKKRIYNFFKENYQIDFEDYTTIVPKNVNLSQTTNIGSGSMINYGCTLAPYAHIGNLVSINRNTSIGHHTRIGDFSTINPGVNIAGNCKIGEGVTIGMGSNIIEGIEIGDNSVVGAGTLVLKNIPPNTVVYNKREIVMKEIK